MILHLVRGQRNPAPRENFVHLPHLRRAVIRYPHRARQPRFHGVRQRIGPYRDRDQRERKMNLVKIDAGEPQSRQAAAQRPCQRALEQPVRQRRKLGCHHHRHAGPGRRHLSQALAQQHFRAPLAVELGGIEKVDASLNALPECFVDVAIGVGGAIAPHGSVTPLPRPQTDGRDANIGFAKRNRVFHMAPIQHTLAAPAPRHLKK